MVEIPAVHGHDSGMKSLYGVHDLFRDGTPWRAIVFFQLYRAINGPGCRVGCHNTGYLNKCSVNAL